jgi:histidinol dehydrogenase
MTAIPARVAGVREIIMVTPCGKDGKVPANTLVAASIARVDRIFKIGGAQAVAALAFGTKSVPRVDKICGPGNIYVMTARSWFTATSTSTHAGPSEVVVIADSIADPAFCAETDRTFRTRRNGIFCIITTSETMMRKVQAEINEKMAGLDRNRIAAERCQPRGMMVIVRMDEAIELANLMLPSTSPLIGGYPSEYTGRLRNADA